MAQYNVTRGYGLLERTLSQLRARKADQLILDQSRQGNILDIGCGTTPHFLINTSFVGKYGIDPSLSLKPEHNLHLLNLDIELDRPLPYPDGFFDVVTMLAVFEHLEPDTIQPILREIHRLLKPAQGSLIITTPAPWAAPVLFVMDKLKLISSEEMAEHQPLHSRNNIKYNLEKSGFNNKFIRSGYFELSFNQWVYAVC